MTENQWPQDGSLTVPPATQNSTAYGSGVSGSPASASKTDTAKEEAANVAGQAAGAAQNVAGTAKEEAANVAAEVKTNARDLLHQAKADLTSQAGTQQQKVAEGRDQHDLYDRLREYIDRSREMYDKRVKAEVASRYDYFHGELVNTLAEGDVSKLGSNYPGATVNA